MSTFLQLIFSGLEFGSIFGLAALGIIIIYRTSKATNFAQGVIGMFNAFVATILLINHDIPTWLAALAGMVSAFILGIVIDLLVIRRARKASIVSKQIVTFGLILVLMGVAPWAFGVLPLNFPSFIPSGSFDIEGASLSYNGLLNIVLGLVIMGVLFYFLQYTKWGLAVRVTSSNEQTAKLMGVPTAHVTMGAWAVAAALGTLSALMIASWISVEVTMMEIVQINALIAGVLGGFQTFYGPVLAAYLIAIARNLIGFYISTSLAESILYVLILLFIVIRPNGLIGKKVVKKV